MRLQALGRCVVAVVCLAPSATAGAQPFVYALESSSASCANFGTCHAPTVHVIDAARARDLGTFVVGTHNDRGTALRLSSDGRLVLVTTVRPDTGAGTVWAVDAVTRQVVTQTAVGANPSDIAVLPDTSRAYVVNNHGDSVSVVELASFTVVATIPVGHFPWRIAASPNGSASSGRAARSPPGPTSPESSAPSTP